MFDKILKFILQFTRYEQDKKLFKKEEENKMFGRNSENIKGKSFTYETNNFEILYDLSEYYTKKIKEKYKKLEKIMTSEKEKMLHEQMLEHDLILAKYFAGEFVEFLNEKSK